MVVRIHGNVGELPQADRIGFIINFDGVGGLAGLSAGIGIPLKGIRLSSVVSVDLVSAVADKNVDAGAAAVGTAGASHAAGQLQDKGIAAGHDRQFHIHSMGKSIAAPTSVQHIDGGVDDAIHLWIVQGVADAILCFSCFLCGDLCSLCREDGDAEERGTQYGCK